MRGSKQEKFITRTGPDGIEVRIPVGIITGARSGPQITLYGGQHGTEYDGIEALQRLYRTLDPANVSGRIIIGLVTHESAFMNWSQFAPTTPEIRSMMAELAQGSQYLINCHGGEWSEGMCPYVICRLLGQKDLDAKAMEMAEAFGVGLISVSQYRGQPPPRPSGERPAWWLWPKKSLADELQIPEITPEVGQRGSRDELGTMYQGLINVLKQVAVLAGSPEPGDQEPKIIGERYWITAVEQGIFFPEVDVCQDVEEGQQLGLVRDYFGHVLQKVVAPARAKVMNMNRAMPVKRNGFLLWLGQIE